MYKWLPVLLTLMAAGVVTYLLLYGQSFAVSKSITALIFVFQPGRDCDQAAVSSCSGWVRHAGRFQESQMYTFTLAAQLSAGDVEVFLLDQERQPLMKLSRSFPSRSITLDGESRYYLQWEFQCATGKCELRWQ